MIEQDTLQRPAIGENVENVVFKVTMRNNAVLLTAVIANHHLGNSGTTMAYDYMD